MIIASSFQDGYDPEKARPSNLLSAWRPETEDTKPYIQVHILVYYTNRLFKGFQYLRLIVSSMHQYG